MSVATDVVALGIASIVGVGGLLVAYLRERGDKKDAVSKWAGALETEVKYCKKAIDKLEGIPGQLSQIDERLKGLPRKVSNIERRLQLVEDVCPEVAKHGMVMPIDGDCESGGTTDDKLRPGGACGPEGATGNDCGSEEARCDTP